MTKMPLVFVGHGSPMNSIEDNQYTGVLIMVLGLCWFICIPKGIAPSFK